MRAVPSPAPAFSNGRGARSPVPSLLLALPPFSTCCRRSLPKAASAQASSASVQLTRARAPGSMSHRRSCLPVLHASVSLLRMLVSSCSRRSRSSAVHSCTSASLSLCVLVVDAFELTQLSTLSSCVWCRPLLHHMLVASRFLFASILRSCHQLLVASSVCSIVQRVSVVCVSDSFVCMLRSAERSMVAEHPGNTRHHPSG